MSVVTVRRTSGAAGAAVIAAASAIAVAVLNGPVGDAPAHLYRTLLVRDGTPLWDNLWFGGHYPLASYSFLYYLPAALIGNRTLVVLATIAAAVLFAQIVHREWPAVSRWPAWTFAVLAAGPLFTGTYSYAVGVAALLGTVHALQRGSTWLAAVCAALTLGFSPLAFVLLCLVLAAALVTRGRRTRAAMLMACALAVLVVLELAALWLFPYEGVYPFHGWALLAELGVGGLGLLLSLRARRAWPLAAFFALWLVASAGTYAIASPLGANLVRVQFLIFPLMLIAALLADMRPRLLVALALAAAFAYNTVPYGMMVAQRSVTVYRDRASWVAPLAFLRAHEGPDYRVEVVPTVEHWDAYYVPAAGFAMARGWYRQLDLAQNPLLYRPVIAPAAYRAWLRHLSVRYVLLPRSGLDSIGARPEADLLASGRSGLVRVYANRLWEIYRLPDATPILTGPGRPRLTAFGHSRIAGRLGAPGDYLLRVRYMPYWQVRGAVCVAPLAKGEWTLLRSRRAGWFALSSDEQPAQVLENVVTADSARCPSPR